MRIDSQYPRHSGESLGLPSGYSLAHHGKAQSIQDTTSSRILFFFFALGDHRPYEDDESTT